VLCPKKLRENWTLYAVNDKRNVLAGDRFNYDVLNHTDLTRDEGYSGEINLASINWGNYDLIVIDESHNFRNNNPRMDGKTRYTRLMQEVIRSGVRTKVLMLSATPVNNRMNDLKNQVAFITEGIDTALSEHGINSIEQTLKQAQARFNQWVNREPDNRTVAGLMDSMNFDYFKLLDLLTIARSRKHIEKYYGTSDIGEFPVRLKPKNIKADIDSEGQFPTLHDINRTIRRLHLSAYAPLKYVRMDKREEYNRKYDKQVKGGQGVFKQVDREQSLVHLMRVNLLKRMESSINSFAMTVEKLLDQVNGLLARIESHEAGAVEEQSIEDIDFDSAEFDALAVGNKIKVLIQDMDLLLWKQDLQEDRFQLQHLLEEAKEVDADRDAKLHELKALILEKVQNPINSIEDIGNKKVIVFTAFADTAAYLYKHLAPWAEQTLGIYSALITGTGTNKTNLKGTGSDLGTLLTNFSPFSKERVKIDSGASEQIDLLIATDCISEGQNLQDCDFLVNYDIHWNPVRIIQRFGRIDRLGSKNGSIQLVNFWPNMELDEYINLEARVSGRMVLLDISATGEENVIEQDENHQMNDLEYRRKQLEQLQEAVVDLEDLAGGVSITDMTLNDFRMDLSAYMQAYMSDLVQAPTGLFAVTNLADSLKEEGFEPGVIFCLRNQPMNSGNKVHVDGNYSLAPHFLVYVTNSGEVKAAFTRSKQILDVIKKQAAGLAQPDALAVSMFNRQTKAGADMTSVRHLLAIAIDSIVGKSQEKGVLSLFSRGGTVLEPTGTHSIDDFEVVSYLVLQ
jgi:ERCC4-related helicase